MVDEMIFLRFLWIVLALLAEFVVMLICAGCHMTWDVFYNGALFLNALIIGWGLPILLRGEHGA